MEKQPNLKIKLILLYVFSFIASTAPLIITLIAKWDVYTETPGDTLKLCAGGFIVIIFLFLKVVGKLKMPRRIVLFGIVFALTYLLQTVLNDLLLLSGMAFIGELLDAVFFQREIRLTKEAITIGKTADKTTEQVEEVIKKYVGRF